ncbi:MAG TPA: hypothetical protein VM052_07120 [Candidatus Limnocylindrales bacterium]|nr:hypothetical protein [Candidatus Limnocylindrales bacterium]
MTVPITVSASDFDTSEHASVTRAEDEDAEEAVAAGDVLCAVEGLDAELGLGDADVAAPHPTATKRMGVNSNFFIPR